MWRGFCTYLCWTQNAVSDWLEVLLSRPAALDCRQTDLPGEPSFLVSAVDCCWANACGCIGGVFRIDRVVVAVCP